MYFFFFCPKKLASQPLKGRKLGDPMRTTKQGGFPIANSDVGQTATRHSLGRPAAVFPGEASRRLDSLSARAPPALDTDNVEPTHFPGAGGRGSSKAAALLQG